MGKTKKFLIDEALAQTVLDYLAGRPYREVYKMIQHLQSLEEAFSETEVLPEPPA